MAAEYSFFYSLHSINDIQYSNCLQCLLSSEKYRLQSYQLATPCTYLAQDTRSRLEPCRYLGLEIILAAFQVYFSFVYILWFRNFYMQIQYTSCHYSHSDYNCLGRVCLQNAYFHQQILICYYSKWQLLCFQLLIVCMIRIC